MTVEFKFDREHFAPGPWMNALATSGRFFRNARGVILFEVSLGEFVSVLRASEFRGIIEDAEVIRLTGDELTGEDWRNVWYTTNDRRWMLPSAGNRAPVQR